MTTLAVWYPGDGAVLTALEVLGMIAILATLTWTAEQFLARRRAALRHALWLAALTGVLLTPSVALVGRWLPWHTAILPPNETAPVYSAEGPSTPASAIPPARADGPPPTVKGEPSHSLPSSETPGDVSGRTGPTVLLPFQETQTSELAPPPSQNASEEAPLAANQPPTNFLHCAAAVAFLVWAFGSVYLAARLLYGWLRVRRVWRRLRPLDAERWAAELAQVAQMLSVERLPVICVSPDVRSPLMTGLFFPRVILPESLPERSTSHQLRDILLHECAHVLRRDSWVRLLQRLAGVLFWVHPLVHLLNRRLDHAREEVCDNHVLAHADAADYAETLLTVSRICYPTPRLDGYLTMIPYRHNLERRVAGLLETRRDTATRLPIMQRAAVLSSLVLLLGAIASVGLHSAAAQEKPAAAASPAPEVAKKQTPPAAVDKPGEPVIPLSGTVLAADGSPAAGATVWAAKYNLGPLVRRETSADAQGRYTLDLDPGKWFVWARRGTQGGDGQARYPASAEFVAGRTHESVEIRMEERGTFHGRLLEAETGKPVAGGKLYLDAGLVLTTDAEGRFEIGGLSRKGHEAFVVAPGRIRMRVLFDTTARADTKLDVQVPAGGKIVGRVTDMDGKPIPGAYVGMSGSGSVFSMNGLYMACDAEGRFVYEGGASPNGAAALEAAAPGYAQEQSGLHLVSSDKPAEIHFQLRRLPADMKPTAAPAFLLPGDETRRTVSGVVRGPDKKPVEGVLVRWGFTNTFNAIETRTDAEGRFRLVVPAKVNLLAVLPRDYAPEFPSITANGDKTIDIPLQQGHTVRGRVLDDSRKPIQDVMAAASVPSLDPNLHGNWWLLESAVHTDADGRFVLKGVLDDAKFDFSKSGMSHIRDHELKLDGADNTVILPYGGAVGGKVVDQDGKPIHNFRILAGLPHEKKPGDVSGGFFVGFAYMGVCFTSEDGSFVLTGFAAGSVLRITAIADGHSQASVDRVIAVPLNHLADAKPVTLRVGPPVVLGVRVQTAEGKPIAGARVMLVDGDPAMDEHISWGSSEGRGQDKASAITGANGWADFPALSFGAATLLVQAPGYARHSEGWRDGQEQLTIELAPEAVLTGEVHDAKGEPVNAYSLVLLSRNNQNHISVGAEDKGRFRVAQLPAGEWTLIIYTTDKRSVLHNEQVTLQAGETKELKIEAKKE